MASFIKIGSVDLLGFPGPARFSASTRNRYFFLFVSWAGGFEGTWPCSVFVFSNYGLGPVNEHPARASAPRLLSATRTSGRGLLCPVSRRQPDALPPAALFPAARSSRVVFLRGLLA